MKDVNQGWNTAVNVDASLLTTMAANFAAGAQDPTVTLQQGSVTVGLQQLSVALDSQTDSVVFSVPCTGTVARQAVDGTLSVGVRLASLAMGCVYPTAYLATNGLAGCDARAKAPWTLDSNALTVEVWVRTQATQAQTLVSVPDAGLSVGINGGRPVVTWGGQTCVAPGSAATLDDGHWHFVAVSLAAQVITFYVDGQSKGTATLSSQPRTNGQSLCIGQGLDGEVASVRLWTLARTAVQLQQAMNATLPLPQPGLVGVWTFDDGQAVNQVDQGVATLQGGATCVTTADSGDEDDAKAWNTLWFLDPEHTFTVTMSPKSGVSALIETAVLGQLQAAITQGKATGAVKPPPRAPTTMTFSLTAGDAPDLIALMMSDHALPPGWPAPTPFPSTPTFTTSPTQNLAILVDDTFLLQEMIPALAKAMKVPESDFQVKGSPPVLSLTQPVTLHAKGQSIHLKAFTLGFTDKGLALVMKATAFHMAIQLTGTVTLTVRQKDGVGKLYYDILDPEVSYAPDSSDPTVQKFEMLLALPLVGVVAALIVAVYMGIVMYVMSKLQDALDDADGFVDTGSKGQSLSLQRVAFDNGVYLYGQLTPANKGASRGATPKAASAPVLTGFSPDEGASGTQVTLTGTGLSNTLEVSFNGTPADCFRCWSDRQVVARVADGTTTGPIQLTTAQGTAVSAAPFTVAAPPTLSSVGPPSGQQGDAVKLYGTGLLSTKSVYFHEDILASFTLVSDDQLIITVPPGAVSGPITVSTTGGTATQDGFVVKGSQVPALTAFTPTAGTPGTEVTVTGAGFTGTTDVTFNGAPAASFTVLDDHHLVAVLGSRTTSGPLRVTNSRGTGVSSSAFNVLSAPSVDSFSPTKGTPGTPITLHGSGFAGATAVHIGTPGVQVPIVSLGDTSITVTSPSGTGSGPVSVETPAGIGASKDDFQVLSVAPPVLTTFSPLTGGRGTAVTITGSGFTGTTGVAFGGVAAPLFEVLSDTELTAYVPNKAVSGPLHVTNTKADGYSPMAFTFVAPPTLSQFAPPSGPVGTQVVLTGTNLGSATEVRFGSASSAQAAFTVQGNTKLTATVPSGALTGNVFVTTPGGKAATKSTFSVSTNVKPVVTGFTPDTGGPGTKVTVTGRGFTATSGVCIGDTPARTFEVNSDTELVAVIDADTTTGPISVTNAAGTGRSSLSFTVPKVVWVDGFTPPNGEVGAQVRIQGGGFTDVQRVSFGDSAMPASFTVQGDTALTATVPSGAVQGPIQVVTSRGAAHSVQSFQVDASAVATLTRATPGSGPMGTQVTVEGAHFTGTTGVRLDGAAVERYQVVSDTQLIFLVPSGGTSGAIVVENSRGASQGSVTFQVTKAEGSMPKALAG